MKFCVRCGELVVRKVMATAKYCSAECRQAAATDAYKARQRHAKVSQARQAVPNSDQTIKRVSGLPKPFSAHVRKVAIQ